MRWDLLDSGVVSVKCSRTPGGSMALFTKSRYQLASGCPRSGCGPASGWRGTPMAPGGLRRTNPFRGCPGGLTSPSCSTAISSHPWTASSATLKPPSAAGLPSSWTSCRSGAWSVAGQAWRSCCDHRGRGRSCPPPQCRQLPSSRPAPTGSAWRWLGRRYFGQF